MPKKFIEAIYLTNYKKHKEFALKVDGNSFILSGKNALGKTSIMQAIRRGLGHDVEQPVEAVKLGENSYEIAEVIVADGKRYKVRERSYKNGTTKTQFFRLHDDGNTDELKPAFQRIKEIFGNGIDLTPLSTMSGEKQFEFLQNAFKIDTKVFNAEMKNLSDDRRLKGQEVRRIEARLASPDMTIGKTDQEQYATEKDVKEILAKKIDFKKFEAREQTVGENNFKRYRIKENVKSLQQLQETGQKNLDLLLKQREELDRKILDAEDFLTLHRAKIEDVEKQLNDLPDQTAFIEQLRLEKEEASKTNEAVDVELSTLIEHNRMHERVKEFNSLSTVLADYKKEYNTFTESIKAKQATLTKRLTELNLGDFYPGLELRYQVDEETGKVTDQGLYLHNLPFVFSQQSYAEIVKVLIILAGVINPDGLNFTHIMHWNELDQDSQDEILKFASENENVQLGIEQVSNAIEIETQFIQLKPITKKNSTDDTETTITEGDGN